MMIQQVSCIYIAYYVRVNPTKGEPMVRECDSVPHIHRVFEYFETLQ
jgi:hypothetical protein